MIEIDDLIGIRYKTGGRDSDGYDCYGLAIEVCKRFGYTLPDIEGANRQDFIRYMNECRQMINVTKTESPQKEGDLILISDTKGILSHVGVYLGNNMFIHCNDFGVHIDKVSRYGHLIGGVYSWQ